MEEEAPFPVGDLAAGALRAARALLGARLVSTVGGVRTEAVIVETEAYLGADDPASHAATASGITDRNRPMFGPPGTAYVYLIYGMHWCVNVVTGSEGEGEAVLLRGAEALAGTETIRARRGGRTPLLVGPGRLCQGLGVTGALDGRRLDREPLRLLSGRRVPAGDVGVSGRIGVTAAAERPWRFYVKDSPGVSR